MKSLVLALLLPLLAGCALEPSMEEAIAQARDPTPVRQRSSLSLGDLISGATQAAGAYARGYSETYQSYQQQGPIPGYSTQPCYPSGMHVYFPPVGQGLPKLFSTDSFGDIYEY
jgi:hypothetical protein